LKSKYKLDLSTKNGNNECWSKFSLWN
jgi:hypothetical protein